MKVIGSLERLRGLAGVGASALLVGGVTCAACAPEAIQVVTPRPAASADPVRDAGSNRADESDQQLRESTDRAAHIQDLLDEPVHMQDEPDYILWRDR